MPSLPTPPAHHVAALRYRGSAEIEFVDRTWGERLASLDAWPHDDKSLGEKQVTNGAIRARSHRSSQHQAGSCRRGALDDLAIWGAHAARDARLGGWVWARSLDGDLIQHSFWLFDTEADARSAEATFGRLREMPDAPATLISVDVCEVVGQA
jgi:hypothetical protein